jgi:predicted DCC family thiol-disulfide oxidoreductase YuxK
MNTTNNEPTIVFFDGYCGLCNGLVNWLLKIDTAHHLRFTSLQSEFAKNTLVKQNFTEPLPESIIVFNNGRFYFYSTAVSVLLNALGGFWKAAAFLIRCCPLFIRDTVYKWTAKNRNRIWGKLTTCRIPTKEEAQWFLEN